VISSQNPFDPSDLFTARLCPISVAPPHTVHSLRMAICAIEGIDPRSTKVFADYSSQSEMEAGERLSILVDSEVGPRGTLEEPFVLVGLDLNPRNARLSVEISDLDGQSVTLKHAVGRLPLYQITMESGFGVGKTKIRKFVMDTNNMQNLAIVEQGLAGPKLLRTTSGSTFQRTGDFTLDNGQVYRWKGKVGVIYVTRYL
jgi:hypothetical protein